MPDPNMPATPANAAAADPVADALHDVNYANIDEWKSATHASRREGRRLAEQLAQAQAELDAVRRVLPSEAAARRDPTGELASFLPVDALDAYVGNKVAQQVEATIGPLVRTNNALSRVRSVNPDFARFEGDWQQWLAAHPDLSNRLQAEILTSKDPEFAVAGAFSMFERERRAAAPSASPPAVPNAATLPATQGSGAGRGAELATGPTREEMQDLYARARRGDRTAQIDVMKLRLGPHPNPELPPAP